MNFGRTKMLWRAAAISAASASLAGCVIVVDPDEEDGAYWANEWDRNGVTDDERALSRAVAARLAEDAELNRQDIRVSSDGDTVTLRGHVRAIEQLERALNIARTTAGVGSVVSKIVIDAR